MNLIGPVFLERLPTLSFLCIKLTNLGKQINEFLNDFVVKASRTKILLLVYCTLFSFTWFDDCSFK